MPFSGLLAAAALTIGLLAGCGSDSGLRSPDYETLVELKSGTEREAWIHTELLIGLPWREAQEMAHDAGWETQVNFAVGDEPMAVTLDFIWDRLRLTVDGGKDAGTVSFVDNS